MPEIAMLSPTSPPTIRAAARRAHVHPTAVLAAESGGGDRISRTTITGGSPIQSATRK